MSRDRDWFPLTGAVAGPGHSPAVRKKKLPVDPPEGPPVALAGRVVTMDGAFSVRTNGVVYLEKGGIVAIQSRGQPPPASDANDER